MRGTVSLYAFVLAIFTIFFVSIVSNTVKGQILEDFSDGDLTDNPSWLSSNSSGHGVDFRIINGAMQSAGPTSTGEIWISTTGVITSEDNLYVWEFDLTYLQAPSSSNRIKIFLNASVANLGDDPEGYYLLLGESGSDDGIDLYTTSASNPIMIDPEPSVADGIDLRIRVTRSIDGHWTVYKDLQQNGNFLEVGSIVDTSIELGDHFGFLVNHSASRNQSFFFDNVLIPFEDNSPTRLVSGQFVEQTQLQLQFSKNLDQIVAENASNYTIEGIGMPTQVRSMENTVVLNFDATLANATTYRVEVNNLLDFKGNEIATASLDVFYFFPEPAVFKDIIITEIMEDPDPPNDLPASEFIELFNRSTKTFNLLSWSVSDLTTINSMPEAYLYPGDYLILCPQDFADQFSSYGPVLAMPSFPSLNNGGDSITIRDAEGHIVDALAYDRTWYNSTERQNGGWTLELIDPENSCTRGDNWSASDDPRGGTPGAQNSVFAENPDLTAPVFEDAVALHPDTLLIRFGEPLDFASIRPSSFRMSGGIDVMNILVGHQLQSLSIIPSVPFDIGINYTITISDLKDCSGNLMPETSLSFHLVELAAPGDLVINEILFDPYPGGADFVEIFNRSGKYIDLRNLGLSNVEMVQNNELPVNITVIASDHIIIPPKDYTAFTVNAGATLNLYTKADPERIIEVGSMPSLPNGSGTIALVMPDSTILDALWYAEDYHFELLSDTEGVSLERISPAAETNTASNWRSAASSVGFATPGHVNSQSIETGTSDNAIAVEPKVIIPDGSGQNDFTVVNYRFNQPGYVANVSIHDLKGREVAVLAQNETLAANGFFTWDGVDSDRQKLRTGYYIILFEVFDHSGNSKVYKEKVIVGTRF